MKPVNMFHMKQFTSKNQIIGEYGEKICKKYLENNNFEIIDTNYTLKVGEIDIIAKKKNMIHFIEVKSVSCPNTDRIDNNLIYNPAQNLTSKKLEKIRRTAVEWSKNNKIINTTQIDLYLIYIDKRNIRHKIEKIENIF